VLSVYPYASGSSYIAGHAITSSYASNVSYIANVESASFAQTVLYPRSGSRGKSVCLLTQTQYLEMVSTGKMEVCNFSS